MKNINEIFFGLCLVVVLAIGVLTIGTDRCDRLGKRPLSCETK